MGNQFWTKFSQLKFGAGAPPSARDGVDVSKGGSVSEKTASWTKPGPTWAGSFNRKAKAKTVKVYPVKHGLS